MKEPTAPAPPNFPDVLGAITGGTRLILDALHVAAAVRPAAIEAGKTFEVLVIIQNCLNNDVDAVLRLIVPDADIAGKKNTFSTKILKPVRIGMRPGETGYANLPLIVTHQAKPGDSYKVSVEVTVEHKNRHPQRIRDASGGTPFHWEDINAARLPIFEPLQGLNYSGDSVGRPTGSRATVAAPFKVLPPTIAGLPPDLRPNFVSLWTSVDFKDEVMLSKQAKPALDAILPKLTRHACFIPLLKQVQNSFSEAGYRLWAGEAVMIAKLLTMLLEMGSPVTFGTGEPKTPRWYTALNETAARRPSLVKPDHLEQLLTEILYPALIHDAGMYGFSMLETVVQESFGSSEEIERFLQEVVDSLQKHDPPLDLSRAYLPFVLAGIVANNRITLQGEKANETISLLDTAMRKREDERDDYTQMIFDIAQDLIERALLS